jgi:superfamily II DNA helicase RecQ
MEKVLCATFPNVPVIAMTATATKTDKGKLKEIIVYKGVQRSCWQSWSQEYNAWEHFRVGKDVDCLMKILTMMAQDLLKEQMDYPLTIMYIPLKWCGFAYMIF